MLNKIVSNTIIKLTNMAHFKVSRISANAPTSSQLTSGTVANPSRFADGVMNFKAFLKYVMVK